MDTVKMKMESTLNVQRANNFYCLQHRIYKKFDSPNGWGTYEHFVSFVEEYLEALEKYPNAVVTCDR